MQFIYQTCDHCSLQGIKALFDWLVSILRSFLRTVINFEAIFQVIQETFSSAASKAANTEEIKPQFSRTTPENPPKTFLIFVVVKRGLHCARHWHFHGTEGHNQPWRQKQIFLKRKSADIDSLQGLAAKELASPGHSQCSLRRVSRKQKTSRLQRREHMLGWIKDSC